jgi:hypothetical protein
LSVLREFVSSGVLAVPLECIVVDNGSHDATSDVARASSSPELPVRVVQCDERGKGAAVRAGVAVTDADIVGFMDADGATDLHALVQAVALLSGFADVAVGSRAVDGAEVTARHSSVRTWGAAVFRGLAGKIVPDVRDTQCGLKVMRGQVARELFDHVTLTGFTFDVELLALAQQRALRVVEFPVVWCDIPGSTFTPARHGLVSFVDLARVAWRMRAARKPAIARPARFPRVVEPVVTPVDEALGA